MAHDQWENQVILGFIVDNISNNLQEIVSYTRKKVESRN